MKRFLLTGGGLLAAAAASAIGSDTILEHDPNGIYVAIISVGTVLFALVVLFALISWFARIMKRAAQKKAALSKGMPVTEVCDSVENGEVIAAIALAIKLHKAEMHDRESDVITINKVARVYSPWSSKIHGLTQMPERVRFKK